MITTLTVKLFLSKSIRQKCKFSSDTSFAHIVSIISNKSNKKNKYKINLDVELILIADLYYIMYYLYV